jgi:DNA-binding transcriptional LysR family regulator
VRIDPKLIIDFATIAEEGSFTRAAQRLRVAQPWLSARLHKLEELLGFRLLDRTTRSVSLTHRGAEFLEAARRVVDACEGADRLALQLKRSDRSVLRIGAAPYTKIIRRRRELIDGFARAHPKVSLELETGWSLALLGRLDAGEIDLTFLMGAVDQERYEGVVLKEYGVALTLSREHPLAAASSLSPEEIKNWPIQVYTRGLYPGLWDALHAPLLEVGARLVEVPEMAEGAPSRMDSPDEIAAFFDFGADDPGTADVVRIPLAAPVAVPFQLLRRTGQPSQAGQQFWDLAVGRAS